jgi:FkbM family methyltransferase
MLHELLGRFGIYYAKRRYMPRGIDWLWDIERLGSGSVRTVIDVGANEGQTTLAVRRAFPGATVHAFEPVGETFAILQRVVGTDRQVHASRLAVSDHAGTVHMKVQGQLSHIVPASSAGADDVESVDVLTLDAYCAQQRIDRIEILKTDTEGHDLTVLKGATRLFEAGKVDWVFTEVTFDPHDSTHSPFHETSEWLQAYGLSPWCFYDHYHVDADRSLLFCNVLFARK